jgi:outer membrane receptor protein involved in Fe transport
MCSKRCAAPSRRSRRAAASPWVRISCLESGIHRQLNEHNLSWRANASYKSAGNGLIYAAVSKGYKAGSFPTTAARASLQFAPVKQESLMAYEVGFKQ